MTHTIAQATQVELTWNIAAQMTATEFRKILGFNLGTRPIDDGWGYLFNECPLVEKQIGHQPQEAPEFEAPEFSDILVDGSGNAGRDHAGNRPRIARFRFFSKKDDGESRVGITAAGQEACNWLLANLMPLLDAMQNGLQAGPPQIRYGKIHWQRRPEKVRITKLVMRSKTIKKDPRGILFFRDNPMELKDKAAAVIAMGINAQAEALGLPMPGVSPGDVIIHDIMHVGVQPVDGSNGRRGMIPRIGQVIATLPVKLIGSWHVGPLQTYGNGRIHRQIEEAHIKANRASEAAIIEAVRKGDAPTARIGEDLIENTHGA